MTDADNSTHSLVTKYRSRMVKASSKINHRDGEDAAHDAILKTLESPSYNPQKDERGVRLIHTAINCALKARSKYHPIAYINCPVCERRVKEGTACKCGLGIPVGLVPERDAKDQRIIPDCFGQYEEWQREEEHIFLQESLLETVPEWLRDAMFMFYVDRHWTLTDLAEVNGVDPKELIIMFRGAKRRMKRMAKLLGLIQ